MRFFRELPLIAKALVIVGIVLLAWIAFWVIMIFGFTGPFSDGDVIVEIGTVVSQLTPTPTP